MHNGDLFWLAIAGMLISLLLGLYAFWRPRGCQCCHLTWSTTTLVMAVRNQEEIIEGVMRAIANFYHQETPAFDLIVVDRGSTDRTLDILRRIHRHWEGFTLLTEEQVNPTEIPLSLARRYGRGRRLCYLELDRLRPVEMVVRAVEGVLGGEAEVDEELVKVFYLMRTDVLDRTEQDVVK